MKLKLSLTFSAYPGGGTLAVMATFFAHYEVAVIFVTNIHAIIVIKKNEKNLPFIAMLVGKQTLGQGTSI